MVPSSVKLSMADRFIQRPESMILAQSFTIYRVEFTLPFVVMRPTNHVAYEYLLARPFLRVNRLIIMDFGNDTIYIRKANKTFHIQADT